MPGGVRGLAVALLVGAILGCGPTPSGAPSTGETGLPHAYSICPPGTDPPPQAATDVARNIIERRLEQLRVEAVMTEVDRCFQVTVVRSDPAIDAVVLGNGRISLVHVPAADVGVVVAGGRAPNGLAALFVERDLQAATSTVDGNGRAGLQLTLTDAAEAAFAAWTAAHVGEAVALVVDGLVVAVPTISEPVTDGLEVLLPAEPVIPVDAIVALARFGPLPPEWEQPGSPQG